MPHDNEDPREHRGMASHRQQLIAGTAGSELETPLGRLRISNVPLFKQGDEGLRQAIRVRVPGGAPDGFTLRVSQGAEQFDEQPVEPGRRRRRDVRLADGRPGEPERVHVPPHRVLHPGHARDRSRRAPRSSPRPGLPNVERDGLGDEVGARKKGWVPRWAG